MKSQFDSANIGTMQLKNRWIMLAMHTGYGNDDGTFSERDFEFYRLRARGGMAAITLVGAVNDIGARHGMQILNKPDCQKGLADLCDIIHESDCKVIMQLYHAGRNNADALHLGPPLAPSAVPSPIYKVIPKEMNADDIKNTIHDFAAAAKVCKDCGVDCIEVSASVGYLLSEFFSSRTNLRSDEWGGSEIKRMKFPTEVLTAIRHEVGPDFPVTIKISAGDMLGGYDNTYMADFINSLPNGTLDGVTVTGGWHEAPVPQISYHVSPGGFSHFARDIKVKTGLPVIACNRINQGDIAEELIGKEYCDFVGAARPFLTDPEFVNKIRTGVPFNQCQGCNKGCIENVLKKKDVCCAFNPEAGKEYLSAENTKRKNILVIGAGPVGLQTALSASRQSHKVTVITDDNKIGGKLNIAAIPPYKQDLKRYVDYLKYELARNQVDILLNTPANEEIIEKLGTDTVIFAPGAFADKPEIEGSDAGFCTFAEDILAGNEEPRGSSIVIIGGGIVGLETAEYLAAKYPKKHISVIEKQVKAGKALGGLRWIMMKHLRELQVEVITSAEVQKIGPSQVEISINTEEGILNKSISADTIIFAAGYIGRGTLNLEAYLNEKNIPYYIVGDAGNTKCILDGISEAYKMVRNI